MNLPNTSAPNAERPPSAPTSLCRTPTTLARVAGTLALGQGIVYLQPSECRVKRGSTIPFVAATNGSELAFTINEDKLTRRSEVDVTGATRFDPRWEGARANLDDAWKKILTNLSYNPKEFKTMQDAVMRLAAQPAAFGIDPGVAERCALTFLAE